MNLFNKALLKIVLLPAPVYKKMGVNISQLKAILNTKLIMDDRRPSSFQQMRAKQKQKPVKGATLATMFTSIVAGGLFTYMSSVLENAVTSFTIFFSFFITFLASILIADFTSVLIDVRDSYIIVPKPVSDKTFVLSRLLHIFIHVCKIVIPMMLPGAIFFTINYGLLVLLVFLVMIFMATLFAIFIINACYILILRITTPQKFQNIISYIQIAFAIFFYACYQLVPRMMGRFAHYDISHGKAIIFLPSYWFAAAMQQVYSIINSPQVWLGAVLSIAAPVCSLWIVIKYFAPSFNQKLALISAGTGEGGNTGVKKEKANAVYSRWLAGVLTKPGSERTGFLFTWKMMLRSRDFKMKVYPSIGYMLVIIVLMFINIHGLSVSDFRQQTTLGKKAVLIVLYFSNMLLITGLGQVTTHDKFKAAWIFFTTPVDTPGKIVTGAVKASIAQFFLPVASVIIITLVSLGGPALLPNILFGICNQLLITSLYAYLSVNKLPFSSAPNIKESGGILRVFGVMIIGGLLAIMHYLLFNITVVILILTIMSAIAAWLIFGSIKNFSWQKLKNTYAD